MSYIAKKKIKGHDYFYLMESKRIEGKVKTKTIKYLGKDKKQAEEKMKQMQQPQQPKKEIKIIYFVHGTTTDNEKGIATGQAHGKLSNLGIKQSEDIPKQIGKKEFDIVFCSDLKRAIDSAKISFGNKNKIIQDKRLRECNYGDLNQVNEEKIIYSEHIETPFPKGESLKDVEARIKDFLEFLKKAYQGKTIAIVSHKAPQLALDVLIKGKTWEQAIKEDWRKRKAWQPGWEYNLNEEQKTTSKLEPKKISFEEMASYCKRRGFVYPNSEIYGSFAGFWDFGPVGVELKNNIKNNWWKYFIKDREDVVGIDGSIITHPNIWVASGHVTSFKDVAVICKKCKKATKIDKSELGKVKCECGGEYESQGEFNLLFKTEVGALDKQKAYLRGETAQLIFADFKLVQENARLKLPFGIGQVGKAFRNEISPRDFLYRSREFEQMELQYFINPDEADDCLDYDKIKEFKIKIITAEAQEKDNKEQILTIDEIFKRKIVKNKWHAYWLHNSFNWFLQFGINKENLRLREHKKDELAHYAKSAIDIEYNFQIGWKEIFGSHDRGQFDLSEHEKHSKKDMKIFDEYTKKKVLPQVIESSFGVDRAFLVALADAYTYDSERQNIVLKLKPSIAPFQIAVFSLVNKLNKQTKELFDELKKDFHAFYDTSGSIGRRYFRQDEIGTPFCITYDFDSIKNKDVTIRHRDTQKQIRVKIKNLKEILNKLINSEIEFEEAGKPIN